MIFNSRTVILGMLCVVSGLVFGQVGDFPGDIVAHVKNLQDGKDVGLLRSSLTATVPSEFRAKVEDPVAEVTSNTAYPSGYNDGSLWQGKGVNAYVRAGVSLEWGWGRLILQPEIWWAQNLRFETIPSATPYGDYGSDLDRLQSYGADSFQQWEWGQSEFRVKLGGFTAGFGSRNLQLGPALEQNLILSNQAAGFPLLDIGTDGPLLTAFGTFDLRLFWGQTRQSTWYNNDPSDDFRLFTGGVIGYSFPFLPDMSFGFQRIFHSPWATMNAWKVFQFLDDTVWKSYRGQYAGGTGVEDDVDQVLSLTWEWRLKSEGARLYCEFGRNDHSSDPFDFLMQPEHSMGFTAGFEKLLAISDLLNFLFSLELSDLGNNIGTTIRPTGSWYRHSGMRGGYTNNGQLLGAPIGPGSNSQKMQILWTQPTYYVGGSVQRISFDADFFYTLAHPSNPPPYIGYNLFLISSLKGGFTIGQLELGVAVNYLNNWNHNFVVGQELDNINSEISVKYLTR